MKQILLIVCFLFSVKAFTQVENAVPPAPSSATAYNDFTKKGNFVTREQSDFLERKLETYRDSTSTRIVIVIVDGLKGYTANEFATALGRKWGVGGKEFSNGVVVLISTDADGGGQDRDAYIATGYGMEGSIPDITAKHIIENELIPEFKEGNYYSGLNKTVDALIKAAAGEYKETGSSGRKGLTARQIFLIILVIWILLGIFGRSGKGGGGYASRRGYRGFGGPFWWGTGGFGGGSSGGGWSGGGGGFGGGFGGGGFGGGGAGGKW